MAFLRKKQFRLVAAAILLLVTIVLLYAIRLGSAERADAALPPEQRVVRNFDRAFDPEQSTIARLNSLRRTLDGVRDLPREKRQAVIIEAMSGAVNRTLTEFAGLPPERKPERARQLQQDAERTIDFFRRLPPEKRQRAIELLRSEESGRRNFDRAVDTILNTLSPTDREMLGPTLQIWKDMVEMK